MSSEKPKKGLRLLKFYRKSDNASIKLSQMWNGDQIPYSLKSCLAFVYYHNINAKHVLRKNGNKVAQEVLCNYLKKNIDVAPTFYMSSVYDVCSAIKAYVKDIPDGLLVKELESDWHKLVRLNNETKVKEKLMSIIQKLPLANKSMLFHLLFLAAAVSEHRHNNEMSTKSLSIVLMPSMFERVVDITKVRDLNGFYDLLEFMIDNAILMMGVEVYSRIQASLRDIGSRLRVVQQLLDEPNKLDEDKRIQFVSQDSGLNSTSFIDDKASQSQSSINRAIDSCDQKVSSMEDLLNSYEIASDANEECHTALSRKKTLLSEDSVYRCTDLQETKVDLDGRRTKQRVGQGLTCMGLKPHNIKECRPFSICGSPSLSHAPQLAPYHANVSSVNLYSPVYDRSFQTLRGLYDTPSFSTPRDASQRRKPKLKRSTCIIAPLERLGDPVDCDSAKALLRNDSVNTIIPSPTSPTTPTSPNLSKSRKTTAFFKQKFRTKRRPTLSRSRLSVPLGADSLDSPSVPPPRVLRAASLQQSQSEKTPLPQPLAKYLRQRSMEETFV